MKNLQIGPFDGIKSIANYVKYFQLFLLTRDSFGELFYVMKFPTNFLTRLRKHETQINLEQNLQKIEVQRTQKMSKVF